MTLRGIPLGGGEMKQEDSSTAVAVPFDQDHKLPPATRAVIADPRNAGPRDKDGVFTEIAGRPIFWNGRGATHAVEGADVHTGVRLLWTRCLIDVPAGEAFITESPSIGVTCMKCRAKATATVSEGEEQGLAGHPAKEHLPLSKAPNHG